jgi:hypothetical protein
LAGLESQVETDNRILVGNDPSITCWEAETLGISGPFAFSDVDKIEDGLRAKCRTSSGENRFIVETFGLALRILSSGRRADGL